MAIVVPFSKPQPSSMLGSSASSPDTADPFSLMAAAQMNTEGRLTQAQSDTKPGEVHTIQDGPEYNKWDEALDHYGAIRLPKELDNPQKWLNQKTKMLEDNGIDREDRPDGSVILRKRVPTS